MKHALLTVAIVLAACNELIPGLCNVAADCPFAGAICEDGVCTSRRDAGAEDGATPLPDVDGGTTDGSVDSGPSESGVDGGPSDAGSAVPCLVDSECRLDERCVSGACSHFEPLCKGTVGFPGALRTPLALAPRAVAIGLLDGDSNLDLVVADPASNKAQILRGKGDGTFGPATNLTLVTAPSAVAVSDLTGDGISDLAVTSDVDGTVSVLQGKGDGTFAVNASYPVGAHPSTVAAVRFNGDANDDLLVASDDGLYLLINRGDGRFNNPARKGLGGKVTRLVAADFTSDGKLDVAAAVGSSVWIVPGDGNGALGAGASYTLPAPPLGLVAGDFTRMNDVDVVAATAGGLVVLQNGADTETGAKGTSFTLKTLTSGVSLSSIVSFDFNDDGYVEFGELDSDGDLAMLSVSGFDRYSGAPLLSLATRVPFPFEATQTLLADIDNSGATDIVIPNLLDNSVRVMLNPLPIQLMSDVGDAFALAIQDMNLDGRPDFVGIGKGSGVLEVMLGVGGGGFSASTKLGAGDPIAVLTGDFNHDQKPDVAVLDFYDSSSGKVRTFLGDGKGGLEAKGIFLPGAGGPSSFGNLSTGDFDGDKHVDLAVVSCGRVTALFGKGDGDFPDAVGVEPTLSGVTAARVGDLDADGFSDVASIAWDKSVHIRLGEPSRKFASSRIFEAGGQPVALDLADMNRDGKLDIVVAVNPWGALGTRAGVAVLLNVGAGLFKAPSFYETLTPPESLAIGDVNGDGVPDIAALADTSRTFHLLMGKGDGTLAKAISYSAAPIEGNHIGHAWIGVGDLNGDLLSDVAIVGAPAVARLAQCVP